jgi:hypothetical protein
MHGVVIEAGIGKNGPADWEAIFSPDEVDAAASGSGGRLA